MESGNKRIVYISLEYFKDLVVSDSKWCPLFGFICYPYVSPSSNISRCVDIITKARKLWNILFLSGCSYNSYPHPDKLPSPYDNTYTCPDNTPLFKYPKEELLTARTLFDNAIDIIYYAQIKDPLTDYHPETGEPIYDLDQLTEDRIMDQVELRGFIGYKGVMRSIESYKVFAILAIHKARWALSLILEDGKPEEDVEVLKAVEIATNLLNRAKEIKAEIDIKKRDEELREIKPDAERGVKILNSARKGGYAKRNSETIIERYKAWQQEANRIWKENPKAKKSFVVGTIIKRFRKEGKADLLRGKELIRKIIKNPVIKKSGKMPA